MPMQMQGTQLKRIGKQQPLYEQIRRALHTKIVKSNLKNGDRLPSIYALAREMDVTYHTVRSAMSLLEQDGVIKYQANRGAMVTCEDDEDNAPVATKLTTTFVRWQGDAFGVGIADGIRRYAGGCGMDFFIADANNDLDTYIRQMDSCAGKGHGLIVIPDEQPAFYKAVERAIAREVPIVFVDRVLPGLLLSSVEADHFAGAFKATRHLLETHRSPVYYLGGVGELSSCRAWVKGWSEAMRQHGFSEIDKYRHRLDRPHTVEEFNTFDGIALKIDVDAAVRLLESCGDEKICIFAGNDYVASGVYMAAERKGRKIGVDLFVVGFGDLPLCENLPVKLSSVAENNEQVGFEAAAVLQRLLCDSSSGHQTHRIVPTELRIRSSSIGIQ